MIIEQLQAEAANPDVSVVTLLQRALIVATETGDCHFADWIRGELNGYEDRNAEVEYRKLLGQYVAIAPDGSTTPIPFSSEGMDSRFLTRSISVIEALLQSNEGDRFVVKVQVDPRTFQSIRLKPAEVVGFSVSRSSVVGLLQYIRTRVIEWTISTIQTARTRDREAGLDNSDPKAVRQQILQAISQIQGNSGRYTPEATIAERLGLKPNDVEGHLEVLREDGKVQVEWNSSGCFAYFTDAQQQKFKESMMANDAGETRRRILQVIMEIQGNSSIYTNDREIAGRLGLTVEEVDGHLEILRDEHKLQFIRDSGGCYATLTEGQKQRFKESLLAAPATAEAAVLKAIPVEITESLNQFRKDHPDPSKVAFVMMRFGSTDAHRSIVEGIQQALQPFGIAAIRADDKEYHSDLWYNVLTCIHGCGFGIAVFERLEADEFNPNVSLEVGHVYGLGKPVCLLKDKTLRTLHTDLVGRLYRPFDPQDAKKTIPPELSKWLKDKGIAK